MEALGPRFSEMYERLAGSLRMYAYLGLKELKWIGWYFSLYWEHTFVLTFLTNTDLSDQYNVCTPRNLWRSSMQSSPNASVGSNDMGLFSKKRNLCVLTTARDITSTCTACTQQPCPTSFVRPTWHLFWSSSIMHPTQYPIDTHINHFNWIFCF